MRADVIVGVGICLALAGCSSFKQGGETPAPTQPPTSQSSAPGTPAPPASSSTAPTTAPATTSPPAAPSASSGAPQPKKAATQPANKPATAGGGTTSAKNSAGKPPATTTPSPSPKPAANTPTPAQSSAPAPAAATAPPAAPALDLTSLEQRLRDTKAIGVFTKLSLKNQVDDLLAQFKAFHNKQAKLSLSDLHQRYDLLLLKVLSLLQDNDPSLASAINSSRDAIWGILIDPVKFSKLS